MRAFSLAVLSAVLIVTVTGLYPEVMAEAADTGVTAGPDRLFARGADLYENKDYSGAVVEYERILEQGYISAPVYYNLANSYFKAGELGKSILYYKRAELIDPRDADIRTNCSYAQSMVKGKVVPERSYWDWRPVRIYLNRLTSSEITMLCSLTYILLVAHIFFSAIKRTKNSSDILVAILLIVVFLSNVGVLIHKNDCMRSGAIEVSPQTDVLFGPFDSATRFFTLNEGMKVDVLKVKDDWVKVRRADGKTGWMNKGGLEMISGRVL